MSKDLWGPPGTGLFVILGLIIGFGVTWCVGLRLAKDWLKIFGALMALGAWAHSRDAVGSNWLMLVALAGLYVAAWRILRARFPAEGPP